MESKTNYTMVGLTVLILMSGLLVAALWLSTGFDRKVYNLYTVYFHEPVSGLSQESVVKYNGVKVGVVNKIELSPIDPQQIKIILKIEEGTPITASTYATLVTQGITGITYLSLAPETSTFIPLQKRPGEPYPVIPSKPSLFSRLEKSVNQISQGLKRILTRRNVEQLSNALDNLQKITASIAKNSDEIDRALKKFPVIVDDFQAGLVKFESMVAEISSAGKEVSSTMNVGKNAMRQFSQQALPPAISLLRRLEDIAANLEIVSAEMRQNPAVIIRGTTPPKPGPGESM